MGFARPRRLPFGLLIVLLALGGCHRGQSPVLGDLTVLHPLPLQSVPLEPGLDYARLEYARPADQGRMVIAALRIDPARFEFVLLDAPALLNRPSGKVEELAAAGKPVAAVNASFYLPDTYQPIGLLVSGGKVLNQWKKAAGSGVFWTAGGKASLEWSRVYRKEWERASLAVQAGPLIIEPGSAPGIRSNTAKYRARTVLGLDAAGRVWMAASLREEDGEELRGLDLYELMQILTAPQKAGGLGLTCALNLDGGTSTGIVVDHPRLSLQVPSLHPVRNAVGIRRRP